MTLALAMLAAAVFGLAVGLWVGGWHKGRKLAGWVEQAYQERVLANREARQAEGRERAAKQRIGEQVRHERLERMFGESR